MTKPAVLFPAFVWDCDKCGVENFARTVVPHFTQEDLDEMRLKHGVDPLEEGNWLMSPTKVTCEGCGTKFDVVHFDQEENEDDDD